MFVVDDLVGWLIGRLADAGYKKLITALRGSDQARALKPAVTAAVEATVSEIGPSGEEEADRVAEQINKAFAKRKPVALPPEQPTLLEALQAGIAGQLSVLDDAGQPVVRLSGVPVSVVADKLTGHLLREIMVRGSQEGPLTPLADQLNHDLTHLQGEEVMSMLAQLRGEVRDALAAPADAVGPAGWPLAEVKDPFALEVHRPVQPADPQPGLSVLPTYVPRDHDAELGSVVRAAADGNSAIAALVGGSSTGKTRACWEALGLLRDRPEPWRLWHPIDPSPPEAALRELPTVGPRTVVWLNEAQLYLDGALGERVAAGLRELLRDPARSPVLVLATLWPEYWHGLTARPAGGGDPHPQARELLNGHDIAVPAAFNAAQLQQLDQAGDARLAQAAAGAQDGQVIQFLAGAPELLALYHNAPPAAAALIRAAMDARRLGVGIALPQAFLEAAASGYLTDTEWDALDGDWLERALHYTANDAKSLRGPLTRIRPRPARPGAGDPGSRDSDKQLADGQSSTAGGPLYRLADYLDQHGRAHRKGQIPSAYFWAAAEADAFPADQAALGDAAHARGLYRDAAQLHKNAARRGNLRGVTYLTSSPPWLRADVRPLDWAIAHASLDDPGGVAALLDRLREADAPEQVTALLRRNPAAHASLDDVSGVTRLLVSLQRAGTPKQVTALADRAAAHAPLDDLYRVAALLNCLHKVGTPEQVIALANRIAAYAPLQNQGGVADLLGRLHEAAAPEQVIALAADRAAAHVPLENPGDVARLLDGLQRGGAPELIAALLRRNPAAHASVENPGDVARLLGWLRQAGMDGQVAALAGRAAAHAPLDDPYGVAGLLGSLQQADSPELVAALLRRNPGAHASLDHPGDVASLLSSLQQAGAAGQVAALAGRAAAHASLDRPDWVARLLDWLRQAGMDGQVTVLVDRAATHASLNPPDGVAFLLGSLRQADAQDQYAALADRAAAHAPLDDLYGVAIMLDVLHAMGTPEQVTVLADRAAAHTPVEHSRSEALVRLLGMLREVGGDEQVTALADRIAAYASVEDPGSAARLLDALRAFDAPEQVATVLADRAAAHASLENPGGVAWLLRSLPSGGGQVTALLHRDPAAHASLYESDKVAELLGSLREVGAPEQVTALVNRLPGEGMFELFRQQRDPQDQFRLGREADGSPAKPWDWGNLD